MDQKHSNKRALTYALLSTISIKTDTMDFTNNSLIAVTAAGTIKGTFVSENLRETLKEDTDFIIFDNLHTLVSEKNGDTSDFILLKDVTLITNQGIKITFNYLYVFLDDIIALSFGDNSINFN